MKLLLGVCLVVAVVARPQDDALQSSLAAAATLEDAGILRMESSQNEDGSFQYAFETADSTKQEVSGQLKQIGEEFGIVMQGSYSFIAKDENGNDVPVEVRWTADENGYRAEGDSIPQAPAAAGLGATRLGEGGAGRRDVSRLGENGAGQRDGPRLGEGGAGQRDVPRLGEDGAGQRDGPRLGEGGAGQRDVSRLGEDGAGQRDVSRLGEDGAGQRDVSLLGEGGAGQRDVSLLGEGGAGQRDVSLLGEGGAGQRDVSLLGEDGAGQRDIQLLGQNGAGQQAASVDSADIIILQ